MEAALMQQVRAGEGSALGPNKRVCDTGEQPVESLPWLRVSVSAAPSWLDCRCLQMEPVLFVLPFLQQTVKARRLNSVSPFCTIRISNFLLC